MQATLTMEYTQGHNGVLDPQISNSHTSPLYTLPSLPLTYLHTGVYEAWRKSSHFTWLRALKSWTKRLPMTRWSKLPPNCMFSFLLHPICFSWNTWCRLYIKLVVYVVGYHVVGNFQFCWSFEVVKMIVFNVLVVCRTYVLNFVTLYTLLHVSCRYELKTRMQLGISVKPN